MCVCVCVLAAAVGYSNGYNTMNGIGDVTMELMAMSNTTCN